MKGITEPVIVGGHTMRLPETLVEEAKIISDMFNLSEVSAISLLKAAEEEATLYPGTPRGLIAVLLYYDSREQLCNSFRTLVQARVGSSWTLLPKNEELAENITQYLQPILNTSLMDRILNLIESMDLTKEIAKEGRNLTSKVNLKTWASRSFSM